MKKKSFCWLKKTLMLYIQGSGTMLHENFSTDDGGPALRHGPCSM
jgi:hypothetical protein